MNKFILVFFSLAIGIGKAEAQSQTFQIETISKPEKLLPTVQSDQLYKNVDKNFVKMSVTNDLADFGTHPVIVGYLKAYQNHYPLTISPDIAWLLICQGFANHINQNPEKFRSQLVGFEGKKTLTVERRISVLTNLKTFDWETVFPEFASQIAEFTGKELIGNLAADFSTTTPNTLVASQITIMESVREFFNYKVMFSGCGISEVTVEGTIKDWEKILKRLDYLDRYDLKWWTSELKPVIQKIIDTKKGKVDKQFWMNMVKYHKLGVYGSLEGIDGWLLKFYPYLRYGNPSEEEKKAIAKRGDGDRIFNTDDESFKSRPIYLIRSSFKEIDNINALPKEIANVPFILQLGDGKTDATELIQMEFWAGFMGVKQDPKTFNIKPEIGWAINRKSP